MSTFKVFPVRLEPGADLIEFLVDFVKQYSLTAVCIITCCGSVSKAVIRFATDENNSMKIVTLNEPMEICSLVGTISQNGDYHLHTTLGNKNGDTVSGHVVNDFIVYTTAEIVLGSVDNFIFKRTFDNCTGFKELVVKPKL